MHPVLARESKHKQSDIYVYEYIAIFIITEILQLEILHPQYLFSKQCTPRVKRGGENKQSDSLAVKGGINWDIAASFFVCSFFLGCICICSRLIFVCLCLKLTARLISFILS